MVLSAEGRRPFRKQEPGGNNGMMNGFRTEAEPGGTLAVSRVKEKKDSRDKLLRATTICGHSRARLYLT